MPASRRQLVALAFEPRFAAAALAYPSRPAKPHCRRVKGRFGAASLQVLNAPAFDVLEVLAKPTQDFFPLAIAHLFSEFT